MFKPTLAATAATALLAIAGLGPIGLSEALAAPAATSGGKLVSPDGMTLYTFDKDVSGSSACAGPCAQAWPPLLAKPDDTPDGDYTILVRADGGRQWAYKGKPLYTYAKDAKAGDATGDGYKDVWHAVKP